MTEIANTPELRFPNYENSWFSYKLNDISERVTRKNKNLESQRPLTISGQLGLIDQIEYFNKSVSSKNLTGYILIKKGEFAYNKSYSNGYPLGAIKKLERYDLGILSSLYICFSFDENIDKSFMKNYFESTKWYREVANIAVEGARNHGLLNIPVNDFFNININLPIQYEQEKIGEFFSKLDRQIELEEKKLELLEQQKRGYMQKIFSKELRFKDENGNDYPKWVTQKIKELGNVYTGNTPSKKQSAYWNSNNYIWVTPTDINNKKNVKNSEYMLSDEGFKKARQLPKNTLLITCIASIGKNAILREEGSCNQQINALVPNNDKNVDFLYYAFEKVSKYMKRIAGKTATQIVNKSTFENISIEVPNIEEQLKIGRFLNSFDKLIEKQVSKIELLKQRKQGLLQKMFV
ncbi:restriction endonuclease subunit S [Staphylococcus sp. GDX8P80P]|uniref:restriction endonuclease subunit S n=1 Tax=Staphylococcus sp. GDX8P80P TaxID=2804104 RepID=UPI001AEC436C|nr:restriction endonuclease subunit S [Staphylococcus sp. GDX8P80P]